MSTIPHILKNRCISLPIVSSGVVHSNSHYIQDTTISQTPSQNTSTTRTPT